MTDEEKIFLIKLCIGDHTGSPFYPLFTDEEYTAFLTYNNGVVQRTIRMAAIAASMYLATINYKEMVGDVEIWTNVGRDYKAALEDLISENSINNLPDGLKPYASGISWQDFRANNNNPDHIRPKLTQIDVRQPYTLFIGKKVLEWPFTVV